MSVIKRLILYEFTLRGQDSASVIRIRESPFYRGFFKKIHHNFVETLETVRNREASVPRGSTVFLFFFDSFSSCPILFFKYVLKIILRIISAAILLIQTRWVSVRAEVQGTNFDPSARKHQNCDMCAFHDSSSGKAMLSQCSVLSSSPSLLSLNLKVAILAPAEFRW